MPARTTRQGARERIIKSSMDSLDRIVSPEESVPLRGRTSPEWEHQAGMISFIIPAYNEESLLGGTLCALHEAARTVGEPYEVIVADDGSTDGTAEVARAHGCGWCPCNTVRSRRHGMRGLGRRRGRCWSLWTPTRG